MPANPPGAYQFINPTVISGSVPTEKNPGVKVNVPLKTNGFAVGVSGDSANPISTGVVIVREGFGKFRTDVLKLKSKVKLKFTGVVDPKT